MKFVALPRMSVTARFTHVYSDGPAVYYTVIADGDERPLTRVAQWWEMKRRVMDAIVANGAARAPLSRFPSPLSPIMDWRGMLERENMLSHAQVAPVRTIMPLGVTTCTLKTLTLSPPITPSHILLLGRKECALLRAKTHAL